MPYLVSSIIAVVSAMIILSTRYDADDSSITAELDRVKSMFLMIDGFVNTHIQSGGNLTDINFEVLFDAGILPGNIRQSLENATDKELDWKNRSFGSILNFPKSEVKWQLIPVRDIPSESNDKDFATSSGSAYKLLVDMSQNRTLMTKSRFSESFSGREYCEKMLFGTFQENRKTYVVPATGQENFNENGTNDDGIFVCIVFK